LIALLTVLSPAPSILVDDDLVHPHRDGAVLLRTALGTATSPANSVVISLALFLTALVMGPVLTRVYDVGIKPLVANEISVNEAFDRASGPLRGFMEKNAREKGLRLFVDMSSDAQPQKPDDLSMRVLVPAFMISELKRAFEIGFLLFLPFLIIDLVVASVLMSMGMMMRPPVVVSLPFKLIFFVLVDGWTPVAGALIQSYGPSGRAPSLACARIAARGDAFRKIRDTGARNTWELWALSGRHTNRRSLWDSDVEYCFGCWGYRCQSSFCWRFSGTTEGPNAEVGRQNLEIGKLEVGIGSWHS
jgi:flagellar biosynthesis protein FliP